MPFSECSSVAALLVDANALIAGEDRVVPAIDRDHAAVVPIDGVLLALGQQRFTVAVDVIQVTG